MSALTFTRLQPFLLLVLAGLPRGGGAYRRYGSSAAGQSPAAVAGPPLHAPGCFGFPDRSFTPASHVDICDPGQGCADHGLGVSTGAQAPPFALARANGGGGSSNSSSSSNVVSLAGLLAKGRPLFIEFGSFS